jgi:hypothetical protein
MVAPSLVRVAPRSPAASERPLARTFGGNPFQPLPLNVIVLSLSSGTSNGDVHLTHRINSMKNALVRWRQLIPIDDGRPCFERAQQLHRAERAVAEAKMP